jgi:osmotically inducible lipoprotein OsmB
MSVEQRFHGGDVMSLRLGVPLVILALTLSACGTTTGDRGLSGAGIGAATGAVVGAVVGGPVLAASAIGAGAGALAGAVTTPNQVDLGKPVWEH